MTNASIIENYKNNNEISEEIHTFVHWQELGYQVRKGEHAKYKITIWKNRQIEKEKEDTQEEPQLETSFFSKTAHFFDETQVDKK